MYECMYMDVYNVCSTFFVLLKYPHKLLATVKFC